MAMLRHARVAPPNALATTTSERDERSEHDHRGEDPLPATGRWSAGDAGDGRLDALIGRIGERYVLELDLHCYLDGSCLTHHQGPEQCSGGSTSMHEAGATRYHPAHPWDHAGVA